MSYIAHQIETELKSTLASNHYTQEQIDNLLEKLRTEYHNRYYGENMSLRMQVEALKTENTMIWKLSIERIAEAKLNHKLKELPE